MRKNKRLISAAVALLIAFSCTACGSKNTDSGDSSSQAVTAAPAVTLPSSDSYDDASSNADSTDGSTADSTDSEEITPAMWEVASDNGTKITFLGSMHALRDEVYPLPDEITSAYENADILAVECDITSTTKLFAAQQLIADSMYYTDGTTIKDHLPEDVYNNLVEFVEACNSKIENYETFQLWALSSQMETLTLRESGLDTTEGIDRYFLNEANEDGKEIYEVESIEFQYEMLMNISEDFYISNLESYSGESKDEVLQNLEDTYEAWKTGDTEYLAEQNDIDAAVSEAEEAGEEVTDEDIAILEEYYDTMLYDRNEGMVEKAEELLEGDKDVFYVVGAAHFVGEGGIIDLLEKDGYTVTEVEY